MKISTPQLDSLVKLSVPLRGRTAEVELRVPATDDLFGLFLYPRHRTPERMSVMFPAEFMQIIRSIDGRPVTIDLARAIYDEPQAAGRVVAARTRLFESLAETGMVFAQCPHCRAWEADVSILAMTIALDTAPSPIVDERMYLSVPSLADEKPYGRRPAGVPPTSRLRFELPSAVTGIGGPAQAGVLGDLDELQEVRAWRQFASDERRPADADMWRDDMPGFRAVLRLTVALERLNGSTAGMSPRVVLALPIVDFYFLDNLYYLTHNVDVPVGAKAVVRCKSCGRQFVMTR